VRFFYHINKIMVPIYLIPLDAWVIILRFINKNNLVDTFNNLFESNVFDIPERLRLDTFWVVIAQARYLDKEELTFDIDTSGSKYAYEKLIEIGIHSEKACHLIRHTNGNLNSCFEMLGWN